MWYAHPRAMISRRDRLKRQHAYVCWMQPNNQQQSQHGNVDVFQHPSHRSSSIKYTHDDGVKGDRHRAATPAVHIQAHQLPIREHVQSIICELRPDPALVKAKSLRAHLFGDWAWAGTMNSRNHTSLEAHEATEARSTGRRGMYFGDSQQRVFKV